jgi:hypothetical protein
MSENVRKQAPWKKLRSQSVARLRADIFRKCPEMSEAKNADIFADILLVRTTSEMSAATVNQHPRKGRQHEIAL